jgi:hypothetical protein
VLAEVKADPAYVRMLAEHKARYGKEAIPEDLSEFLLPEGDEGDHEDAMEDDDEVKKEEED